MARRRMARRRHAAVALGLALVAALAAAGCGPLEGVVTTEGNGPTSTVASARPAPLTTPPGAPTTAPAPPPAAVTSVPSTAPPPPPSLTATPGIPVVDALRLGEGGIGRARFGQRADEAVLYVTSVLGAPGSDTGWGEPTTDLGTCPGTEVRVVRWGWLALVLSDRSDWGVGRPHLAGWVYGPAVDSESLYPDGLALATAVAPGATLAAVRAAYPSMQLEAGDDNVAARFRISTSLGGWATGSTDADTVTALEGGATCRP